MGHAFAMGWGTQQSMAGVNETEKG